MTISSRTPEGLPHRCPVCGQVSNLEPSFPGGDSVCPRCGHLLWWFRDKFGKLLHGDHDQIRLETPLAEFGLDSLDIVELIMEIEEELGVTFPEETWDKIHTVGDLLRLIEWRRREEEG